MGLVGLWAPPAGSQERGAVPRAMATPAPPASAGSTRATPNTAALKASEKQLITMEFQDVEIGVLV